MTALPEAVVAAAVEAAKDRDRDRMLPWVGYLDRLEAAARAVDDQLLSGATPDVADLAALVPPDGTLPVGLADRRLLLLALLDDVTVRAQARRDTLSGELASMAHKRPGVAANSPSTLGGTLDVVG